MVDFDSYLSGERLYGDDFDEAQIRHWFDSEKEGYADLGSRNSDAYHYGYHALNWEHGFRHLPRRRFSHVLGFGSCYGDELRPIVPFADHITIVDASDAFKVRNIGGVPVAYIKPRPEGTLPFDDESFELITCFGVLHHIPNVTTVARELFRCIKPGGYLMIREPTVSMGDWRKHRSGLTANERGIPLPIFEDLLRQPGFEAIHVSRCMFSLTSRLGVLTHDRAAYGSSWIVKLDKALCKLFVFNRVYHPRHAIQKARPTSCFAVLQRTRS
jgi:SAM-dependent methyltransferase